MYTTQNNRQQERQLDREEEVATDSRYNKDQYIDKEALGTDRCTQHRTIDRQREVATDRCI